MTYGRTLKGFRPSGDELEVPIARVIMNTFPFTTESEVDSRWCFMSK